MLLKNADSDSLRFIGLIEKNKKYCTYFVAYLVGIRKHFIASVVLSENKK